MNENNFKGVQPHSKIPKKDFSSLEGLTRRRKSKAGEARNVNPPKDFDPCPQLRREPGELTQPGTPEPQKKPHLKPGDIVGANKVMSVTPENLLIVQCTCGKAQEVTEAELLLSVGVCRHTNYGRYSEEFKHSTLHKDLYKAWLQMCESNAVLMRSIYPPWQSFRQFSFDVGEGLRKGWRFVRVVPAIASPEDSPGCFAWVSAPQARNIARVGLPIIRLKKLGAKSLVKIAVELNISVSHIGRKLAAGDTPELVYLWLVEQRRKKEQKEALQNK